MEGEQIAEWLTIDGQIKEWMKSHGWRFDGLKKA